MSDTDEVYFLDEEDDVDSQVIISMEYYRELVNDQAFLHCLKAAGVDNWEGYSEALEMMENDSND